MATPEVGEYRNWFTWLQRSLASVNSFGEQVESFSSNGNHAAKIEAMVGTRETVPLDRQRQRATIRFKCYISGMARTDRLQDTETSLIYEITGLWREWTGSNWQTVCEVLGVYNTAVSPPPPPPATPNSIFFPPNW